ncbi:hypothetical protein [Alicyclobacillus tolerans]|uniref:Uncharacterized protein n=2 Tax=Alicyclobacillus tolerans TaxID=90970 RepID=A0ABT9LTW5_9BACL|nr:hypothetical protein [Alicyclobacillus tengchongensis]MDP9727703.1 hypothetical protein [Alicyclobacillus tengchongensis]
MARTVKRSHTVMAIPKQQKPQKHAQKQRHLGRRMFMVAAVIAVAEFLFFQHYNALLIHSEQRAQKVSLQLNQQQQKISLIAQQHLDSIEKLYSPLVLTSPNRNYVAYVNSNGTLKIKNLSTEKLLYSKTFSNPITFLRWIRNDEVFVGENDGNGQLVLKTANLLTGSTRLIQTFAGLSPNAQFLKITDSPYTNDMYILIADSSSSVVYHYDTDGNMFQTHFGGLDIRNISVSETGDILYFEDYAGGTFNVGYLTQSPHLNHWSVHLIQQNAGLIGCVGNTFYYAAINQQGLATAVYKFDLQTGQSTLVENLQTPTIARYIDITSTGKLRVLTHPAHYAILTSNSNV